MVSHTHTPTTSTVYVVTIPVAARVSYKSTTCVHAHINWPTCLLQEENAVPSSQICGVMIDT